MNKTIGIDTSLLDSGGGLTHIIEILDNIDFKRESGIRVIIWGKPSILNSIKNKEWIIKSPQSLVSKGYFFIVIWKIFCVPILARKSRVNIILDPSGMPCFFKPYVSISQNMLPFKFKEIKKYGLSKNFIRFIAIRYLQSYALHNASGVIFPSNYSKIEVLKVIGKINAEIETIPHGVNHSLRLIPTKDDKRFNLNDREINLIYVSRIDMYKNHHKIIEAIYRLRILGFNIKLNLVGDNYQESRDRLNLYVHRYDPKKEWIVFYGLVDYDKMKFLYKISDIGIIASTCETFCIPLLEKMSAGLPIACSNLSPMKDILSDSGFYFNPDETNEIANTIKYMIENKDITFKNAYSNYIKSLNYSWGRCSQRTFSFVKKNIINNDKVKIKRI